MQIDPKTTHLCCGCCDGVPDEVRDDVFASVKRVPAADGDERSTRAADLAPRMALEGWRLCRCFSMLTTTRHEMIHSLVHAELANRLAHWIALPAAASGGVSGLHLAVFCLLVGHNSHQASEIDEGVELFLRRGPLGLRMSRRRPSYCSTRPVATLMARATETEVFRGDSMARPFEADVRAFLYSALTPYGGL